jgi:hypothetical protein
MITRDQLKSFSKDFPSAVKSLEEKYGIKIQLGSISYSETEFHARINCTEVTPSGEKKVDIDNFNWLKQYLGFKGNIGDTYTDRKGITYTVYDLDGKKPKFPVLVKGSDGKNYKTTVYSANMQLTRGK